MTDLEAAWDALRTALPPRRDVGRPSQHGPHESVLYAFDPTERPKVGTRTREQEASAPTERDMVHGLTRRLASRG